MVKYLILFVAFLVGIFSLFFSKDNSEKMSDQPKIENNSAKDRVIVFFKGDKYDITDFLKRHPGGKTVLLENKDKDIEKIMQENEHSSSAYQLLEKYKILE